MRGSASPKLRLPVPVGCRPPRAGGDVEAGPAASRFDGSVDVLRLFDDGYLSITRGGAPLHCPPRCAATAGQVTVICLVEGVALRRCEGDRREWLSAPACLLIESPLSHEHLTGDAGEPLPTVIEVSLNRGPFGAALSILQQATEIEGWEAEEASVHFTPAIARVVADLLERPIEGALTQLYLESKAQELVCLVLSQAVQSRQSRGAGVRRGRSSDLARTQEARAILLREQGEPPKLENLARRVGMNRSKLAACFKEMYGQGVYTFFRSHRLERARRLLVETEMSVSQVSDAVGYESVSSFSNSFRAQFGLTPGACRKGRARQSPIAALPSPDGATNLFPRRQ